MANTKPMSLTIWPPDDHPEDAAYAIKVDWEKFEGRYEPKSITVTTRRPDITGPITGTVLRSLPIGKITDYMRARVQDNTRRKIERGVEVPEEWLEAWEKGEKPRLGVEHYERVAEVYKQAFAAGASPTKAVAETFKVSSSTAASWVSRARHKYELLGDTPMGKAGI